MDGWMHWPLVEFHVGSQATTLLAPVEASTSTTVRQPNASRSTTVHQPNAFRSIPVRLAPRTCDATRTRVRPQHVWRAERNQK